MEYNMADTKSCGLFNCGGISPNSSRHFEYLFVIYLSHHAACFRNIHDEVIKKMSHGVIFDLPASRGEGSQSESEQFSAALTFFSRANFAFVRVWCIAPPSLLHLSFVIICSTPTTAAITIFLVRL